MSASQEGTSWKVFSPRTGKVYLVGAGPGDPELISLKAWRCLQQADVVIHDRLVDERVLAWAPAEAEIIAVGKKGGHYSFPQDQINELLVRKAREKQRVVRLKGGDPFLFGRGGEEALYLTRHGIPFEVIPGISSALAVPAAAGIPVTQRHLASSLAVVTGHQAADSASKIRWDLLARGVDTLVVLMPLNNLRAIVSQLVLNGRSLETPAAVIQAGTLETQVQVVAPLREIFNRVREAGLQSPALLVVGEVVKLSQELAPLLGQALLPAESPAERQAAETGSGSSATSYTVHSM